jgi:SAM-dependent methyltransferase
VARPPHAPPDAFGRAAELYERARPGWPPAAVEHALHELGLGTSSTVTEVGAGTGKLTRELVPRVARVVAVEPDEEMRAVLERVVPEADARAGRAEKLPLPDASVDAVLAAEAFHWFDAPAALVEFARVLRPGGGVALLWNASADSGPGTAFEPKPPAEFWEAHERRSLRKRPQDSYGSGLWREAFAASPFGELSEAGFANSLELDRDGVIDHMQSWSVIAGLPDQDRRELVEELRSLLDETTIYRRRLETRVYSARLEAGAGR